MRGFTRVHVREGVMHVGPFTVCRCVQYRTEHHEVFAYGTVGQSWEARVRVSA